MKTSRRRAVGVVTACVFTSLAFFISLQIFAGAQQSQAPVFRSKVEIVELNVSVLDKHRQPIKGLTLQDFTVLEDGKPQKVVGFATFDADAAPPPATGWMKDVPPDVTTNSLKPEARMFVIVMDDALIPQDPFAIRSSKTIALSIIDKLGPDDLTAVVFTGDNRKTQDFTNDKTKLRAALDRFNPGLAGYLFGWTPPTLAAGGGRGGRATPPTAGDGPLVDTDLWFYQSSIRAIDSIADFLASVPNRRKAVFLVSPGVPLDLDPVVPRKDDDICVADPPCPELERQPDPMVLKRSRLPPATMVELSQRLDAVFRRAQRANVTFYPIDPTGLGGMDSYIRARLGQWNFGFSSHKASAQQDYLAAAAANTGGRTVMNTNEFEPGITSIFDENKSYYYLAIEPANPAADGKLHKLQVKVDRPDVDVRTRSGYYAAEAETKEDKKIAKSGMTPEAVALAKSMAGILPVAGMPMKAAVAAFAVPNQRLATVTVVLGVTQPIPPAAAKDRVTETTELLTSAFTPEGDPRGAQKHVAKVVLRAGSDGTASYEVLARIDLPAGRYQLRLAAHNTTAAKDGSVFVDVIVPDFSNIPFSATQVVLNSSPGRVAAPKDLFLPLLPLVPTAERAFAKTDKVSAFMRLYQSGQKPIEKVAVSYRIRDEHDQIVASDAQTIGADQFPAVGQDAIAGLPPIPAVPRPVLMNTPTPTPTTDKFANLSLRTADVKYQIPMSRLSPGPHLLTIEATLGTTVIRRDVRFEVK